MPQNKHNQDRLISLYSQIFNKGQRRIMCSPIHKPSNSVDLNGSKESLSYMCNEVIRFIESHEGKLNSIYIISEKLGFSQQNSKDIKRYLETNNFVLKNEDGFYLINKDAVVNIFDEIENVTTQVPSKDT